MRNVMLLCAGLDGGFPVGQRDPLESDQTFIGAWQIGEQATDIQRVQRTHDVDQHLPHPVHLVQQRWHKHHPAGRRGRK